MACKLQMNTLAVQHFNPHSITVMLQLLDWSAVYLLGKDEEIYDSFVHYFMILMIPTISSAGFMHMYFQTLDRFVAGGGELSLKYTSCRCPFKQQ